MNIHLQKGFILILISFFIISCSSPQSKESYMKDFGNFMTEVNADSEKDWDKLDEKYDKFSGDWYNKFKDDFTIKDHLIIKKYQLQYNFKKVNVNSKEIFNTYDQLKEQVKFYYENGMRDDLNNLLEQAKSVGNSAVETIEQVLNEIDTTIYSLIK